MFMFLPWHHINIICSYFWCKQKGRKIVFSMSPPDLWYRSEAISPDVQSFVKNMMKLRILQFSNISY